MRDRKPLDDYIAMPEDMMSYMTHYGKHFSKKAYEYAVSLMRRGNNDKINKIEKQQFESMLKSYNIRIENNVGYDAEYVYCMAMSDFYNSSIIDEHHLLLFVKDMVDDVDAVDGFIFNRWYADMCLKGIPILWEELL